MTETLRPRTPASPETEEPWRLDGFLPYRLSVASNAVSSLIAERYRKRFGLKIPEWRVMAVLGDAGGPSGRTQRDLTSATLMDKVAVNRACKVLEERGLIARAANMADGRSHLLELTFEGRAVHAEIMPLARATEAELFEGFAPAEQGQVKRLLEKLYDRAIALSEDPPEGSIGS
jgi:DNA-binding MarR family transcriptional regulator